VAHFWWQRLSAVALILLGLWFVCSLLGVEVLDHARATAWLTRPINAFGSALFVLAALLHSQLGIQVVIEDYVHDLRMQRAAIVLAAAVHVLVAAAGVLALIRIAGGGGP
jgi:succinate dehydrogenase / fumarate reductase membrane anchor subunit